MICSKCGNKTKVLTTRNPNSPGNGWEVTTVRRVIDWYTIDFVVRRRKCEKCDNKFFSAELSVEDIVGMMQNADAGHAPNDVIKTTQKGEVF